MGSDEIKIQTIIGNNISSYIDSIAEFRINVFKEFPYLYQGNVEGERKYLVNYANDPQATLIVAKVNSKLVGIATGIPLNASLHLLDDIRIELSKKSFDPKKFYYCGEMIILEDYRNQGLGAKLYEQQKSQIQCWGFTYFCALTVKRSTTHPLKPKNYIDIKNFLDKIGYKKFGFELPCHWPTILSSGKVKNIKNKLILWTKEII